MSLRTANRRIGALAAAAVTLSALVALGLGGPAQASPLLTVSLGGKPLLNVDQDEEASQSSGSPLLSVSALTPTSSTTTQAVGVSVDGKPVLEVNTPSLPAAQTPTVPVTITTPTVTTPTVTTPTSPTSGTGTPTQSGEAIATEAPATKSGAAARSSTAPTASSGGAVAGATGHEARTARTVRRDARRSPTARRAGTKAASVATIATPLAAARHGGARTRARTAPAHSSDPLSSLGGSLPLPLPVPDWSKPIILALVLLALALWLRSRRAVRRARRLERTQETLLADLDAMQAALVPAVPPQAAGAEISVAYRPAEGPAAGGDFYDVFARGEDEVAVILGDVAGHGREALEQAALTRYTLRAHMQTTASPREALALAGQALASAGGEQLATVAAAVYNRRRGTLTYALAGHPQPLLDGVQAPESPLACSSPPLGWDVPTGRRQRTVTLPPGARACFFSDGLVEARCAGDRSGAELLGRERLRALFERERDGAEGLLGAVRAHAQATPDDMAACILTSATEPSGRHLDREELEVDERAVVAGQLQSFLEGCGLRPVHVERLLRRARLETRAGATALVLVDRSRGEARAIVGRATTRVAQETGGQLVSDSPAAVAGS